MPRYVRATEDRTPLLTKGKLYEWPESGRITLDDGTITSEYRLDDVKKVQHFELTKIDEALVKRARDILKEMKVRRQHKRYTWINH